MRGNGTPEGSATQWYVFTETVDDQLKLLGYDSATNQIIGWNLVRQSACPA